MAKNSKILHLMGWDKKFVPSFIQFLSENFHREEHRFIVYGDVNNGDVPKGQGVIFLPHLLKAIRPLMAELRDARKVIIHGMFSSHLLYLLMLQPWFLRKCYWAIWGGDLYIHQAEQKDWRWKKNEWIRSFVIKRLGHFITHIRGDYELAQKWYGAKGVWYECFMYPSNLYQEPPVQNTPHEGINILLGNSADPSNNHIDALEKLRPYTAENIQIFCPLSYGDAEYAKQVADYGESIFGDKFNPLLEFMRFDEYKKLLAKIDIAIFNHKRQQGIGNITTLLGLGKSVYMRSDITSWGFFNQLGVKLFDVKELDLQRISQDEVMKNRKIISNYFSKDSLIRQLQGVCE